MLRPHVEWAAAKEQSGHNHEHQNLTQKESKHLPRSVIFWTIVEQGSGMNHDRQQHQYHHESGEYPLHERTRFSSTFAGNSRYSNDAAALITKDTVSATETEKFKRLRHCLSSVLALSACLAQARHVSELRETTSPKSLPMPPMGFSCTLWRLFFLGSFSRSMRCDAPFSSTCLWGKCRESFLRQSTWQT